MSSNLVYVELLSSLWMDVIENDRAIGRTGVPNDVCSLVEALVAEHWRSCQAPPPPHLLLLLSQTTTSQQLENHCRRK